MDHTDAPSFDTVAVSLLHLAAAVAVTLHALLSKRDVRGAFGWIGLAWLSPMIGSVLYLAFGINRVRRRARELDRPSLSLRRHRPGPETDWAAGQLAALYVAAGHITGRAAVPGNRIALLDSGDQAYPAMLAAIQEARSSIGLMSYIFRDDAAGRPFIDALIDAHRRGVEVRVLIDGFGGGYLVSPTHRALRRAGVPTARFLHSLVPWRMPFLNMRTHKKILVVDGAVAFTGGLNIGAENLAAAKPPHPVRDTHFRIEGPVVDQLVEAFAEDWLFATNDALGGATWVPAIEPDGPATVRTITSGPDEDLDKLEFVLLTAVGTARRSIRIATPYFLPDDRLSSALELAAQRGVAVDLVLPERSNMRPVDWATRAHLPPLLAAGCRLWYSAPPFDHSKLMAIDGLWSTVGSANWDIRSFRLNFELNVEVYDPAFATEIEAVIDAKRARPVPPAELEARPFAIRVRDAAARLMLPYL